MNFRKFPRCILEPGGKKLTEVMNWLSSSLLDEVAPTQSSMKRL